MRVLLLAEACNPEWVSVPLEGWSHSRAIASLVDAHLVTQIRNRDAIVRTGLREDADFTSINSEAVEGPVYRLASKLRGGSGVGWTTLAGLNAFSYPYYEHLVWKKFGPRIKAREFDIVHRITPLSPTATSLIAPRCRKAGVPFVMGPLNGGVPWPKHFDSARRREKEWLSYIRGIYKIMPGFHSTRRAASAIILGSRDTWAQMPEYYRPKCVYIPENAIDPARFMRQKTRPTTRPVRGIFIGRLVPYKGADMLIEAALPLLRNGAMTLDIVGDGPQMPELKDMVRKEGVESTVQLPGWIEHSKLQERLVEADLFTFPSIREFGGAVALEAMATGVVPIVVDYGGPGELVTDQTGWLLPIGSREQIVGGLRALLTELAADPARIDAKSKTAFARARTQFTWQAKAAQVVEVYKWVLDPTQKKPDFGMPILDLASDNQGMAPQPGIP
jgi:glycosyltransferase involved in cell wall biosynthesis